MKISDVKDVTTLMVQQYQKGEGVKQTSDKQASGYNPPEEKVDLSTQAKDIQLAKKVLDSLPEIREEKVQELKDRIEKGLYNVDSGKIADKMVGESLLDIFA